MLNRLFTIASVLAVWLLSASTQAAVPDLELRIDPLSGGMRIVAVGGNNTLGLDGYTIGSLSLQEVIVPGSWNSLTDQLVPGFAEVVPAGQELLQISELNFTSSLAFTPGAVASLGNAYDTTSGSQDMVFQYSQAGTVDTLFGNVIFGLAPLEVRVSRFSGATRIVNPDATDTINLDGYTIQSASLASVIIPGNWNSLTDQLVPGFEEVVPAGQELYQITELNLTGSKAFTPGTVMSLGNVYDSTSGTEDLVFQYSQAGTVPTTLGSVIYEDGGLHIRVNKSTGTVEIVNSELMGIDFDAYVIQSPSGLLDNTTWNSLQDQATTGWEEAASDSLSLSELNFTSSSVLPGEGLFDLGVAYTGGANGAEDLTFNYSLTGGVNLSSAVEYVTFAPADFDEDFDVDGADLTKWEGDFGVNGFSDADSDGDSDGADFLIWQRQFGSGVPPLASSVTQVPEPASVVLLITSVIAGMFFRIGNRRETERANNRTVLANC